MTPREIVNALLPVLARQAYGPLLACEEWGVLNHAARADVAALDDVGLHLVEVKSDADTLRRLPAQVETYSLVADWCSVVTGHRLHAKARDMVPAWWGVYLAHEGKVECLRSPLRNEGKQPVRVADLLWSDEAKALARANGVSIKGRKRELSARLVEKMGDVSNFVASALRHRRTGIYSAGVDTERPFTFRPVPRS